MSGSLAEQGGARHLLSREMPKPTMAKANLTEREKRASLGRILKRTAEVLGKTRKEMAGLLGVDEGQLGRWYSGDENAQVWRYHHAENPNGAMSPRDALRLAEAEDADGVRIRTVIEMVR